MVRINILLRPAHRLQDHPLAAGKVAILSRRRHGRRVSVSSPRGPSLRALQRLANRAEDEGHLDSGQGCEKEQGATYGAGKRRPKRSMIGRRLCADVRAPGTAIAGRFTRFDIASAPARDLERAEKRAHKTMLSLAAAATTLFLTMTTADACSGCGCRGGPGYRGPSGRCVGWADIGRTCGSPPTSRCTAEGPNAGAEDAAKAGAKGMRSRRARSDETTD